MLTRPAEQATRARDVAGDPSPGLRLDSMDGPVQGKGLLATVRCGSALAPNGSYGCIGPGCVWCDGTGRVTVNQAQREAWGERARG